MLPWMQNTRDVVGVEKKRKQKDVDGSVVVAPQSIESFDHQVSGDGT